MSPSERKSDESDLSLVVQTVRRRIWVVVICLVVAVLGSIALTLRAEKEYSATSALLLRPSAAFEPQRGVETTLQLLALPEVAQNTAGELQGISRAEVSEAVSPSQQGDSDIIQIEATSTDPDQAAKIANTFADQFVLFAESDNRPQDDLSGEVEVVERAVANDSPVSPKPARNVSFGALIGLALGFGLALLLEQLDRRVKRQDDLPEVTGLSLVATVPRRRAYDADHLGRGSLLSPAEAEVFVMLRANLRYFNLRKEVNSVLVASAGPGEGKTLTSIGLVLGAALSGERALLIEADMRDPSIGWSLGVDNSVGLSGLLSTADVKLPDAVTAVDARYLVEFAGEATLNVLPSGPIPPNPTQLIESGRMRELLVQAEREYDFVVVDSPPLLVVADAIPLVRVVSGVLAVSGLGVSTRSSANDLADQLERLGATTLGLVANFANEGGRSYEGYGYGRPPEVLMRDRPPNA